MGISSAVGAPVMGQRVAQLVGWNGSPNFRDGQQCISRLDVDTRVLGCSELHAALCRLKRGQSSLTASSWTVRNELLGQVVKSLPQGQWKKRRETFPPAGLWVREERVVQQRNLVVMQAGFPNSVATGVVKTNKFKVNLNEYMITLEKPIGIRFAQTLNGKVYVEAIARQGNAEKSMMIMVGDILKKTSAIFGDEMWVVEDFGRSMHAIKTRSGPVSMIFERSPPPVQADMKITKAYENFTGGKALGDFAAEDFEVVAAASDDESDEIEWAHGDFNHDEYQAALARSNKDFTYDPNRGISYSKMTDNIYVGSCIQSEADVQHLAETMGITAVLNLQRKSEQVNWGINGIAIDDMAQRLGLIFVDCPIRDVDTVDLRQKLPYAVGVLHRLLRRCHCVYVTCTTGLDRSPTCIIGYLHWIQDVSLPRAYDFVTSVHPSGPDRPALVWATWDLIAMAEKGKHDGPPTHAVQFVWNHGCNQGEEVLVVGEFTSDWTKPIKANHASGTKYIVNLRLPQGRYMYKFIVGGHWRHSHNLPTDGDRWGNVNNVIQIGDMATSSFNNSIGPRMKDPTTIKVIERPLTEDERFTLAFAARKMAFSISPLTFQGKR